MWSRRIAPSSSQPRPNVVSLADYHSARGPYRRYTHVGSGTRASPACGCLLLSLHRAAARHHLRDQSNGYCYESVTPCKQSPADRPHLSLIRRLEGSFVEEMI